MMPLTVMTFNLLKMPRASWRRRMLAAARLIAALDPDVVGTQEGTDPLFDELLSHVPGYDRLGHGREADGGGMQTAVLYRRDRFALEDGGHFWLSRTPSVAGTRPWLSPVPRMATWARLRQHGGDAAVTCVNTHFGHWAGATQAVHLVQSIADLPRPLVVTGDFNAFPLLGAHVVFRRAGLVDAWQSCGWRAPWQGCTWHAMSGLAVGRIDWIFASPELRVHDVSVVRMRPNGTLPSDHYPVVASMSWEQR